MQNKEILQKCIEKAVSNGWKKGKYALEELNSGEFNNVLLFNEAIIFDMDFAKAFWGSRKSGTLVIADWKHYLQQLAIAEDRLKYLEQFL